MLRVHNLLVTGGCGFIGANFIHYLLGEAGFAGRVVNLDALTYAGNPLSLEPVAQAFPERYVFVHGSVCDAALLDDLLARYDIDAVCHFAAESHVDRSIASPDAFIETNITGTYRLLEAVRRRGGQVKRFHHISTDEVFGSLGETGRFSESTPYAPNSPYSASKAASDHLVRAYHATYGLPVTVTNCSNNYGPYQFPEKLIPLMILNARDGKSLPIYGDGRNVRDWLYVTDHCAAVWTVLQQGSDGETYCIGGGNELPNLAVVEQVCDLVDEAAGPLPDGRPRRSLVTFVKDRAGHDRRYAIDASRIERALGWTPRETFATGLRRTVTWFLEHAAWIESVRTGAYQEWIDACYGLRPPTR